MKKIIPFNKPLIYGQESKFLKKLFLINEFSGNGFYTQKCSNWIKKNLKCKDALLVNSCTAALEMCALLLNIKEDDEIIMPSYTFVSTANAFTLRGGKPVFIDIDPNTLNIDPEKIEKAITKKTKAIVIVHYAGISCDLEKIIKIKNKHKIYLIEDAAQALLSNYKKKPLGSFGDLATISFHDSKNIHCGEGGALLINNSKFIKKSKIIRDKGTNRNLFNRKKISKYSWVGLGSSYSLSELNAAFLYAQLLNAKKITNFRKKIFFLYNKKFKELEKRKCIIRPTIPKNSSTNGHIYYIHVPKIERKKIISYLKQKLINSVFHYIPLHNSKFGKKNSITKSDMSYTIEKSKSILRLPLFYGIKKQEILHICKTIQNYFNERDK